MQLFDNTEYIAFVLRYEIEITYQNVNCIYCSYMYYNQLGGVVSINRENFHKANGYANDYWGWGSEDDDLSAR